MAKINVEVVDIDGELLFKTKPPQKEVAFDLIRAMLFAGGSMAVTRDGQDIFRTESIGMAGTHAAMVCFIGPESPDQFPIVTNAVTPDEYKKGDLIVIETPNLPDDFDYAEDLLNEYKMNKVMEQIPTADPMSVGDLRNQVSRVIQRGIDLSPPSILRLRHSPIPLDT